MLFFFCEREVNNLSKEIISKEEKLINKAKKKKKKIKLNI